MASAAARERYARKNEAADLKRAFNVLDSKGDGKIDPEELNQVFQALGHKPRRGEVEDLIWEVDEDCDGCIGWQEFQRMYHRCRQDSTGEAARAGSPPAADSHVLACRLLPHGLVQASCSRATTAQSVSVLCTAAAAAPGSPPCRVAAQQHVPGSACGAGASPGVLSTNTLLTQCSRPTPSDDAPSPLHTCCVACPCNRLRAARAVQRV